MKLPTGIINTGVWLAAFGLAAWILSQLPLTDVLQAVTGLSVSQWLPWVLLNLTIILLLVGRWRVLTYAMGLPCTVMQLLRVRQAGGVISFVTPGPQFGGEPFQIYWLWQRYKVPGHAAFLALGLDRFYELWINFAVLLVAVIVLLFSATLPVVNWYWIAALLTGLISLMGLLGWLVLGQPQRSLSWIKRLTSPWQHHPRLSSLDTHWSQLSQGLQQLFSQQRPALGIALGLSLLGWAGMIGELWLLLHFVEVTVDITGFMFLFTVILQAV